MAEDLGPIDFVTLTEDSGGHQTELADLYVLDLPGALREPYIRSGLAKLGLKVGLLVPLFFLRLFSLPWRHPKGWRDKFYILLGTSAVVLLSVMFALQVAVLLAALVGSATSLGLSGLESGSLVVFAGLFTVAYSNLPPSLRTGIEERIVMLLAAAKYVSTGEAHLLATGMLYTFIEQLAEKKSYARIDIVSYSIGSVIALDALFPRSAPNQALRPVHTLVTVGCPADILESYWQDYFAGRHRQKDVPVLWVNVFEPLDLFASNFIKGDNRAESLYEDSVLRNPNRDHITHWGIGTEEGELRPGVNTRYATHAEQGLIGFLLTASNAHRAYWDPSSRLASSVFDPLATTLFPSSSGKEE